MRTKATEKRGSKSGGQSPFWPVIFPYFHTGDIRHPGFTAVLS